MHSRSSSSSSLILNSANLLKTNLLNRDGLRNRLLPARDKASTSSSNSFALQATAEQDPNGNSNESTNNDQSSTSCSSTVAIQAAAETVSDSTATAVTATAAEPPSTLGLINLLVLLFYATLGSVMPYLPVFYKHLGVSDNQIGILGAITPAITFVVSPLWGAFADMTGWHKEIMLLTFLGSIAARTLLVFSQKNLIMLCSIVALSAVLNAPVKPLIDSAIMSMLTDKSAYGKSRLYGQVGLGVGSFLVSPLINTSYRLMFLIQLMLAAPTAFLMTIFQSKKVIKEPTTITSSSTQPSTVVREKNDHIWSSLKQTFSDVKVWIFFLVTFLVGISSGIIENFAYVRLNEIPGSTGQTLGFLRLASSLAGGPMFWISGEIIKKIGVNGVMNLSLLAYVIRFFVYGSVSHAYYALPAEILRGFSFAMFWSGATYYVYNLAPKGLTATMLSILNGTYAGIGQSLGSLLGGQLCRRIGIIKTFRYCGYADMLILALFLLYQQFTTFGQVVVPAAVPVPIAEGTTATSDTKIETAK